MNYNYILHEEAQKDYEASLHWYKERSNWAAEKFVSAINDALKSICEFPKRWNNKYKNYHELSLKKFPFTIVYTIEAGQQIIVITAIYHHKRNPKKKYRKL